MIRQSLLKRKPKSDVASLFVGVLSKDKRDRPKALIVPGSEGKEYHVILRRFARTMTTECRLDTGKGHLSCPGNGPRKDKSTETICYHSRAAVDYAIEHRWNGEKWVKSGFKGSWCSSEKDANRLQKMVGGTIFNIKSNQNSRGVAWVVITRS